MSTYYATFSDVQDARDLVHQLLRSGVRPEDISLVSRQEIAQTGEAMAEVGASVGDATSFVGRADDPRPDELLPSGPDVTDYTSAVASPISGIDTSNTATNVDSVDQADDSQWLAEDMLEPPRHITQGEHERDDLELAIATGFPTPVPVLDDIKDSETEVQDQFDTGLEVLVIPGMGTSMGTGALATAALDVLRPDGDGDLAPLVNHLKDEGMPEPDAYEYATAFYKGETLLGVQVNPGSVDEGKMEEYVSLHSPVRQNLVDAPRFYEGGGYAA